MTITVRTTTASLIPTKYSLTGVSKVVGSAYIVHSLSVDRNMLFGSGASANMNTLYISTDDANSWSTAVATFNARGNNTELFQAIVETPDGEVLVFTGLGTGFPSYVYKSTGWGTTLAQHMAATWTVVYQPRGGSFIDVWGARQAGVGSNGVVVASVYNGGQTNTSSDTTEATRPRYVVMSSNNGNAGTWSQIFDVMNTANGSNIVNVHIHTVFYHEAWDRIWVTFGDSTGGQTAAGAGNCMIAYSDDRGNTWNYLPWPTIIQNTVAQFTSSYATPNAIFFIADNTMAMALQPIMILPITGYRTFGNVRLQQSPPSNSPYGKAIQRAAPGLPLIIGIAPDTSTGMNPAEYPELLCSPDDVNIYPLWKDPSPVSFHSGFYNAVTGPSIRGKIVAQYETGQLIGTLSGPA